MASKSPHHLSLAKPSPDLIPTTLLTNANWLIRNTTTKTKTNIIIIIYTTSTPTPTTRSTCSTSTQSFYDVHTGGISSLLGICQAGIRGSQASAAAVSRNLAKFAEIRENFTEENALVVLLGLASSGTVLAQENAIGCMANLISEDEGMRVPVVKEGGFECLKNFWDSAPPVQSLEVAVEMLRHLASTSPIAEVLAVRIAAARAVCALEINKASRSPPPPAVTVVRGGGSMSVQPCLLHEFLFCFLQFFF